MSICELIPDDPSCAVPDPDPVDPVEPVDDGGDMDGGDMDGGDMDGDAHMEHGDKHGDGHKDWSMSGIEKFGYAAGLNMLASHSDLVPNLAFLGVTIYYLMYLFFDGSLRYKSEDNYYEAGKLGNDETNYWELADMIKLFGGLGIFGVLMVTQLLATLGIMSGLNMMLWHYVGGFGGLALHFTVNLLRMLGMNAAWGKKDDSNAIVKGSAQGVIGAIQGDWFKDSLVDAAMGLTLMMNYEGWWFATWNNLSVEEQEAWIEGAMEVAEMKKEEWADKEAEEKPEEKSEEGEAEEEEGEGEEGEEGAEGEEGDAEVATD